MNPYKEAVDGYDHQQIQNVRKRYVAMLKKNPKDEQLLCAASDILFLANRAFMSGYKLDPAAQGGLLDLNWPGMGRILRRRIDLPEASAAEIFSYIHYISLYREPGMPPLKPYKETKGSLKLPNGQVVPTWTAYYPTDMVLDDRIAQLVNRAEKRDPNFPLVLVQRAYEEKDPNLRFDKYYRAWRSQGGWLFREECLHGLSLAIRSRNSTQEAQFLQVQDSVEGRSGFMKLLAEKYSIAIHSPKSKSLLNKFK